MVARVIQGRLQKLAERVLPESQCGLRRWRGCIDMVFTVQQFTEKMIEHRVRLYPILIDLSEAYDLVPDEALWTALCKLVCMYIHTFVNPYLLSKKKNCPGYHLWLVPNVLHDPFGNRDHLQG